MKCVYCIALCIVLVLLAGCAPEKMPATEGKEPIAEKIGESIEEPIVEEPPEETIPEEPQQIEEPEESVTEEQPAEPAEEALEESEVIEEETLEEAAQETIQDYQEPAELSEDEQIQQIFDYAKTRLDSYYYKYKSPLGKQYIIYVKQNKIKITSFSYDNEIYIDTEKQTAEEWCTIHSRCGKETGKIADLDYSSAYIETPVGWLDEITEARKIDEGFYYGKQAWQLDTNIGKVIIDSRFGFIFSIEQEDKLYLFTDAAFNTVKDSDVNVPEYLLES
ncbi:hypothetical protein KY358_00080 [Candidatus Woesearchaeota archaeon]|nr:hypothetical protein [Candidatus Woesearchaeota archaeon]